MITNINFVIIKITEFSLKHKHLLFSKISVAINILLYRLHEKTNPQLFNCLPLIYKKKLKLTIKTRILKNLRNFFSFYLNQRERDSIHCYQ